MDANSGCFHLVFPSVFISIYQRLKELERFKTKPLMHADGR